MACSSLGNTVGKAIRFTTALAAVVFIDACSRQTPATPRYVREGDVAGVAQGIGLVAPLPNGEWHLPSGDHAAEPHSAAFVSRE